MQRMTQNGPCSSEPRSRTDVTSFIRDELWWADLARSARWCTKIWIENMIEAYWKILKILFLSNYYNSVHHCSYLYLSQLSHPLFDIRGLTKLTMETQRLTMWISWSIMDLKTRHPWRRITIITHVNISIQDGPTQWTHSTRSIPFFFSTVVGSGDGTPLEDADFSRDRVAQSASGVAVRGLCHLTAVGHRLRVSQSQSWTSRCTKNFDRLRQLQNQNCQNQKAKAWQGLARFVRMRFLDCFCCKLSFVFRTVSHVCFTWGSVFSNIICKLCSIGFNQASSIFLCIALLSCNYISMLLFGS